MEEYTNFLSDQGRTIFNSIIENCKKFSIGEIDYLEVSMLANSFDLYAKNAQFCKEKGATQKPAGGGWDQIRPEYTVMKNEYQNILKHSAKFGLNPGDRAKIFNMKNKGDKGKKGFDLTGDKMKVA